jgi:spermidine synthase
VQENSCNVWLFYLRFCAQISQEVVDIDGAMVDISRKWFGLGDASSLQIHVDDGLKFIRQLAHNGMNQ